MKKKPLLIMLSWTPKAKFIKLFTKRFGKICAKFLKNHMKKKQKHNHILAPIVSKDLGRKFILRGPNQQEFLQVFHFHPHLGLVQHIIHSTKEVVQMENQKKHLLRPYKTTDFNFNSLTFTFYVQKFAKLSQKPGRNDTNLLKVMQSSSEFGQF